MKAVVIYTLVGFLVLFSVLANADENEPMSTGVSIASVVTAAQPGLTVEGEVRTVDAATNPRLWGKGRPNTKRYGTTGEESGLCAAGSIDYGLSFNTVDWGSAADACPAGTWVCSRADLESGGSLSVCDTARPGNSATQMTCDGVALTASNLNHWGWLADSHLSSALSGSAFVESNLVAEFLNCHSLAVWCCSQTAP